MAGPVAVSSTRSRSRSEGEATATSVMGPRVVATLFASVGSARTTTKSAGGSIRNMDCDVIVVGTGLSGLVVAHELAAANRSVIMLDAEPLASVGGQAYWSLGGLFMVNSAGQRGLRPVGGLLAPPLG